MLEQGKLYKHKYCTDVAIRVVYVSENPSDFITVLVHWINVAHKRRWILGTEDIVIKREDLPSWKLI